MYNLVLHSQPYVQLNYRQVYIYIHTGLALMVYRAVLICQAVKTVKFRQLIQVPLNILIIISMHALSN